MEFQENVNLGFTGLELTTFQGHLILWETNAGGRHVQAASTASDRAKAFGGRVEIAEDMKTYAF